MNADEVEHLRELLKIHKKRLNVLEEQAAKYGINCPPEIKIEIEDIQEQIARFEQQLQGNLIQSYVQGRETLSQFNREMDSVSHSLSKVVVEEKRTYRFFGLPIWSVVISRTILTSLILIAVVGVGLTLQVQQHAYTAALEPMTAAAQAAAARATAQAVQTEAARATAQAAQTEAAQAQATAAQATAQATAQVAQTAQPATYTPMPPP